MCYGLLIVKYRTGSTVDDKPIQCKDDAELTAKLREVQNRPEAVQIDVFKHDPHASAQLVQEWRPRASIAKPEAQIEQAPKRDKVAS